MGFAFTQCVTVCVRLSLLLLIGTSVTGHYEKYVPCKARVINEVRFFVANKW